MRYEIENNSPFAKAFKVKGGFAEVKPGEKATVETVADLSDATIAQLGRDDVKVKALDGEGDKLPALTGKNKAELANIAKAEGVEVSDDATNAQIVEAIEAKRNG